MKTKDDVELIWQNHFNSAIGYYELGMLSESERELRKIDPYVAAHAVPMVALRLAIAFSRREWNEMKAIAGKLSELDPSNPKWSFSDGYATAKIDSAMRKDESSPQELVSSSTDLDTQGRSAQTS
jgi:hypothetical protein